MDSTEVMKALLSGSGEMADTQVLGTCVFGRAGSSPASRTQYFFMALSNLRNLSQNYFHEKFNSTSIH